MAFSFSNDKLPGDIKIGDIGSKVLGEFAVTLPLSSATNAATQIVYIAPYPVNVTAVSSRFGVASTSGTYMLEKLPSGTAPGSGVSLFAAPAALSGTANTNLVTAFVAGTTQLNKGDALNIIFAGTVTGLSQGGITITLQRQ